MSSIAARSNRWLSALLFGAWPVLGVAPGEGQTERLSVLENWQGSELSLPTDVDLLGEMQEALELRLRRGYVRALDALDPGELIEDARLNQATLDVRPVGLEALFAVGDDLFELSLRLQDGLGNGLAGHEGISAGTKPAPNYRRVQEGDFGGPDEYSCASCHSLGGLDGAGTASQVAMLRSDGDSTLVADWRSPPHLLGLGPVERLAAEMSADLMRLRDEALREATESNSAVRAPLTSKGVEFGFLVATPNGELELEGVSGVSSDLVVRPFGWKGHQATIRDMSREAFRIHQGLLSMYDEHLLREGLLEPKEYGDGHPWDADADGIRLEIDDGMLTSMVAYLAQLETPQIRPPDGEAALDAWAIGRRLFEEVGCDSCHRPTLPLFDSVLTTRPQDPMHADSVETRIDVAADGEAPKVEWIYAVEGYYEVPLFSDLRRHDMGEELASPGPFAGVAASQFLTRSLWGLAETAPYLHDGRAPTIDDAIRLHGGAGASSRDSYLRLTEVDRTALLSYLGSLSRKRILMIP